MLSFLSSIYGRLMCLKYSFYLMMCLTLVRPRKHFASVQVVLVCYRPAARPPTPPPQLDTGASTVQCVTRKAEVSTASVNPSQETSN